MISPVSTNPTASNKPKVIVLTSPGIFGAEVLRTMLANEKLEIAGIGLTGRIYKGKGTLAGARQFLRRTGWDYTWYNILTGPVSWTLLSMRGALRELKSGKIPVQMISDVNSPETLAWMNQLAPDYVASLYFNQWIGAEVRDIPRRDCVNVHPSLLPDFRGPDPVFRMLQSRGRTAGVTLHRIADEFDAGKILYQERREIPSDVTAMGLYLDLIRRGSQVLSQWLAGEIDQQENVDSRGGADSPAYQGFPTPCEVREFLRNGQHLYRRREWSEALNLLRSRSC